MSISRRASWTVCVAAAAVVLAEVAASVAPRAEGAPTDGQIYLPPGGVLSPRALPSILNGPALILGQIVDAATGRGISHAIVRVQGPNGELTQVADDAGRFFAGGLKGGHYQINATKSGYLDGAYGRLRAGGEALPLSVLDHQWIGNVRVTMWRPAVISGYVTDELGEPVVHARVDALRRDYDGETRDFVPVASDMTDDEGAYRLPDLMPGEYRVVVPVSVSSLPESPSAVADAIADARDPQMDAAARSAAAAAIADSFFRSGEARSSGGGTQLVLSTLDLTPAAHRSDGPVVYQTTYFPGALTASSALTVTLASNEKRDRVDVRLEPAPGGTISGTVVGPSGPRGGQSLRLIAAGDADPGLGREVANTVSDAHGAFEFPMVPQGDYIIDATSRVRTNVRFAVDPSSAASAPVGPLSAQLAVPDEQPDGRPLWGRADVALRDRRVDNVTVTMDFAGAVSGLAIFESAAPPEHLAQQFGLNAIPLAGTEPVPAHATVYDDHTFAINGLARGEYFLRVTSPAGWYLKSVTAGARDLLSTPIDLTSANEFTDLIVTFTDKPTEIGGAVQDGKRAPVATATVVVFPAERSFRGSGVMGPERMRAVRVETSGAFHLVGLPPGDYLIVAIDEATAAGWQEPSRLDALRRVATHLVINAGEARLVPLELTGRR